MKCNGKPGFERTNTKITQEEADELNKRYGEIITILEDKHDCDLCGDYWIEFDNYVNDGKVKSFCYPPNNGYTESI